MTRDNLRRNSNEHEEFHYHGEDSWKCALDRDWWWNPMPGPTTYYDDYGNVVSSSELYNNTPEETGRYLNSFPKGDHSRAVIEWLAQQCRRLIA